MQIPHDVSYGTSLLRTATYLEEVLCQPCKKMISYLNQRVRAATSVTPLKKVARLDPSSRCPLAVLSPNSRKNRKENLLKK